MKYIDTHSHPHFPQYDDDRDEMLERMRERGVATIAVGTNVKTSKEAVALAKEHNDVVLGATIGVHPTDTNEQFDSATFQELWTSDVHNCVVGIGECGFDYFRTPREEVYEKQKASFEAQIAFAVEHDLPLMLHVRPSKGSEDAHEDAIAVLKSYQKTHGEKVRGNTHFFTGSLETAQRYFDIGFTIAVPGVVTFAKEVEEVSREAPLEMILSETDAPYAAPVPHRGKRNEPAFVVDVVEHIAKIRGEEAQIVRDQLLANAKRVFGI